MDFLNVRTKLLKSGATEIYPDFIVTRSSDIMVRGRSFYAIWDEEAGLWSTDEYDVARLVDKQLYYEQGTKYADISATVKNLKSFDTNIWNQFKKFCQQISDNSVQLDQRLTFANTEVTKADHVSKRLPYDLAKGDISAWDELIGTLYSAEDRAKLEWAIGAIVSGDSTKIQKFLVLYGPAGTGKSTILNIVEKLFVGYTTSFEAKALGSNNAQFATEVFKGNPLVAIQHDGDLSRIEDNSKLNSIISHEEMTMNEKYKPSYTARVNAFLFMGTNQPVRISDAKSGIIRRLIDVHPTGAKLPPNKYHTLMSQVDFELGAIAQHCLDVYRSLGKNYYNNYRPIEMMFQTDVFFNFIEDNYDVFKRQNGATLKQAYSLYKEFCNETGIDKMLPQYKFREELRNYFDDFKDRHEVDGEIVRSYYLGFNANKFRQTADSKDVFSLSLDETTSGFDRIFADAPAQYATEHGTPEKPWARVKTILREIDTTKLHYVKVPQNHIVIDFDLKDDNDEKSLERNLEAASMWPSTYAELSKSGSGVHLHYTYVGSDFDSLSSVYAEGIEVKLFTGNSALRRRVSKCNSIPVAEISSGLPKKEKKVLDVQSVQSEKALRDLVSRNLRKEIHPGTKPSIDFIKKILDDAYDDGLEYDLTDMRGKIMAFAANSSNQSLACLKVMQQMKFTGANVTKADELPGDAERKPVSVPSEGRNVLFDVEVYPNLFVVCWKYEGAPAETTVRMINPTAQEVEQLFKLKLIGFNNRKYDNHIIYAAMLGYDNKMLYELSQNIIDNKKFAGFGEAYNISYADIFDFSSKKQSLKKFQIDLGILHKEMDLPWDQPVPKSQWARVVDYCVNDVVSTDAVLQDRRGDFIARQILAELSGLTVNDGTAKHAAKIIFGDDKQPQKQFVYTDLSKEFPDYKFEAGKSYYRDEKINEGGYVYAEPGYHENVALLDIASMHPTTMEVLNIFGDYTLNFSAIKEARIAIKRGDFEDARKMYDGRLKPYLESEEAAEQLAYALKIVINTLYGLTSAKFDNPFRDPRNVDNIVAKRGSLFMIELKNAVRDKGFTVVHVKTDSIKIADATPEIIEFVTKFGEQYGYEFEHEATYNKMVLVNDAVYIAQTIKDDGSLKWTAVGAEFQHPYVYKMLFSDEQITDADLWQPKSVAKGHMYLDPEYDKELVLPEHMDRLKFVGRTGLFVPVVAPTPGASKLYRVFEDKAHAVAGTKNYLWAEAETVKGLDRQNYIDVDFFDNLVEEAKLSIEQFTGYQAFIKPNRLELVSDEPPF
jgi:energy-coupling factor transporter ATP-binding protein EcfA2